LLSKGGLIKGLGAKPSAGKRRSYTETGRLASLRPADATMVGQRPDTDVSTHPGRPGRGCGDARIGARTEAMKILALSGSLRAASANTALLEAMKRLAPADVAIVLYRDLRHLPAFNPDIENDPPPPAAALRAAVGVSDGIFIACPEYAHGLPGAFKNALDWLVGSTEFPGKPVALINAAPRAFHAQASLREILNTMSAQLVAEAFVTVKAPSEVADVGTLFQDAPLIEALSVGLGRFAQVLRSQTLFDAAP
jgi:chromate reductase, NAD(P)H dehydrogenase (quinone)